MMADLVDYHVAYQIEQVLAAVAPVIEDRPAVEIDRVHMRQRIADALMRQCDAAIESQQVERAVEPHRPLGLLVGEFLDPNDDLAEMLSDAAWDRRQGARREGFQIGERGWSLCH